MVARADETDQSARVVSAEQVVVRDITPFSLGIETYGGVTTRLIERGTPLPAHASYTFSTSELDFVQSWSSQCV